jgi:hypothetical protein
MNPINLLIKFTDGTTREVRALVSDLAAFEDKFDKSVADFQKGVRLTWLVFIAWHAEFRTKATGLEYEEYINVVESIEVPEVKK